MDILILDDYCIIYIYIYILYIYIYILRVTGQSNEPLQCDSARRC